MKIIKRSGVECDFDGTKIVSAIRRANESVIPAKRLREDQIGEIYRNVEEACISMRRSPNVEEIQDLVEDEIMAQKAYSVARNYITYRY